MHPAICSTSVWWVQAALASLVPSKGAAAPGVAPAALAQQVADALRRALGVQEPRLIGLLKVRSARCCKGLRRVLCGFTLPAPPAALLSRWKWCCWLACSLALHTA